MRLSRIKLAGFKSFVDPTTIKLPSNLVGIVGPNGCGKSNTIDAVRWVMGESSAKHLRGDSMEDVIFTGSSARKPVGQASVELVFDNTEGKLGGQYAQYSEISIRRQVVREGQSTYFLNGSRCRRRDITDIFLGTGLGPRSYAIIEQGTISRLVEAKPDDLRTYLEEAAGISKYKERRRETENRIRHTRDNLDRLDDLREEIDKQLTRLKRQSTLAEKYKKLKTEERQIKAQLLGLRWIEYSSQISGRDQQIRENELKLEQTVAEQRTSEAAIEKERALQISATDEFNSVQAECYKVGADVSRLEQTIQHKTENRRRQLKELEQIEDSLLETQAHVDQDERRIAELSETILNDEPTYNNLKESQKFSAEILSQAEAKVDVWQAGWDQFSQQKNEPAQSAQVELTRMDQLEKGLDQLRQRDKRLQQEYEGLETQGLSEEIEDLLVEDVDCGKKEIKHQQKLKVSIENVQRIRDTQFDIGVQLDEARGQVQALLGRKASLHALQQAALGQDEEHSITWLQRNGLSEKPRLAQEIEVTPGWEKAAEAVLGPHLEAVCVDGIDGLGGVLVDFYKGKLSLVEISLSRDVSLIRKDMLCTKIISDLPIRNLTSGVYVSDTLEGALAMRSELADGESIVTKRGVWVGKSWLRIGESENQKGVLAREKELTDVVGALQQAQDRVETLQKESDDFAIQLNEAEALRDTNQQFLNDSLRTLSEVKSELSGKKQKFEQLEKRRFKLNEDIDDVQIQIKLLFDDLQHARERRAQALMLVEEFAIQSEQLQDEKNSLSSALVEARERANSDRDARQEIAVRVESMRSSKQATLQSLERMQEQTKHLVLRHEELKEALSNVEMPVEELKFSLEAMLERRLVSEKQLKIVREKVETTDQRLRQHEQNRVMHERQAASIREQLQTDQLETQEVRVRIKTIEEQVDELSFVLQVLLQTLPEDASISKWEEMLAKTERSISRLGPINLAAIDEYEEQLERKEYLDSQHQDVVDALETLEAAIAKIDKETRARFRDTFDKVNTKLQEFFPHLFGGGQAMLEMTGDNLLDTGVSVLARPPGKRVSNIHLLSGGEKALTAVAMVFAFFELNPSPFCMLDEVDAPLDDANVSRFCKLVKEMSKRVQFIFITHNKGTMELSDQLVGVTMQEPGVSRLVAVDVEEAAQMVEA